MSETDIDLARRAYSSFDLSSPLDLELFADDFIWQPVVTGSETASQQYVGPEGWRAYQEAASEVWASLTPELDDMRSLSRGLVLGEGKLHGVGRSSGAPVTTLAFPVIRIRDGRVAETRIYQTLNEALAFAESASELGP